MRDYPMSYKENSGFKRCANSVSVDSGSDRIVFNAVFDVAKSASGGKVNAEGSANGSFSVGIKDITTDIDYDYHGWNPFNPEEVAFTLHFNSEVKTDIHGSAAATIPLGKAYIQIPGTPLNIAISLTAHVSADGNITVDYTTQNVMEIGWKKQCGLKKDYACKADATCDVDALLTAKVTMLADLRLGFKKASLGIANAQVCSGISGAAKLETDLLGDLPTCLDLQVYVPLSWGVNQQGCVLTEVSSKLKATGVIWNSENSPVHMQWHFEDGKKVEACTRNDRVEQELVTAENEPLKETDPFEFAPLEFDFIELDQYSMYLDPGQSMDIGFESIPEGYSVSDLIYEVEDGSVCSVSNGTVYALASGSTIVKVKTSDGLFTVAFVVTVKYDYSVPTFEEL